MKLATILLAFAAAATTAHAATYRSLDPAKPADAAYATAELNALPANGRCRSDFAKVTAGFGAISGILGVKVEPTGGLLMLEARVKSGIQFKFYCLGGDKRLEVGSYL